MIFRFWKKLKPKQPDVVEIPVGGIKAGVIYEKEVRPDGNEPIYKEVNIGNTESPRTAGEKENDAIHKEIDTSDK